MHPKSGGPPPSAACLRPLVDPRMSAGSSSWYSCPLRQQGGRSRPFKGCAATAGQVLQHIAALLAASSDHGKNVLNEMAAGRALSPIACLAPLDRVAQRPLRRVVGRLDGLDASEGPQRRL